MLTLWVSQTRNNSKPIETLKEILYNRVQTYPFSFTNMVNTYSTDMNLWIKQTIDLLREERWNEIDVAHLIEEVEDLGK